MPKVFSPEREQIHRPSMAVPPTRNERKPSAAPQEINLQVCSYNGHVLDSVDRGSPQEPGHYVSQSCQGPAARQALLIRAG